MLRMCFLQPWCSLSDECLEDASHDSQAMRDFLGRSTPTRTSAGCSRARARRWAWRQFHESLRIPQGSLLARHGGVT